MWREKRRGGQGYVRLARGGRGELNIFIKKFRSDQQFDRQVYLKRGPLAKMGKAVKLK